MEQDGYPGAQLAKAEQTAATHPDPATRGRARERAARWIAVIRGMLHGDLDIGGRTPVAGLPAWVSPTVVHGGFATGSAAAGGPLRQWELAYAREHALRPDRAAIFAHAVQPDRLAALVSGHRAEQPEQAALPVLAWLVDAGDQEAATALLTEIAPFRDRLCFLPEPAPGPGLPLDLVWRSTVAETRERLRRRAPQPRVAIMNDTLTVWNLYADRMLALWLRTVVDGRVGVQLDPGWKAEARTLLEEHGSLAAEHPPSRRHAGPKANLTVLRTALADVLADRPWRRGLVQTVTGAMVARRGEPGHPRHRELRERQAADAARPLHHVIAHAVADRMATLPPDTGTTDAAHLAGDVPPAIAAVVRRATAAPVEELITAGLVPSAEVLAELSPRIAAQSVAAAYPDPRLAASIADAYLAFRRRRSLLLLNLRSQVRPDEMPWVRAAAGHRAPGEGSRSGAAEALRRLGGLTSRTFPGTLLPNIAYAWREMIFHLSLGGPAGEFVGGLPAGGPLGPAVHGLRRVVAGGAAVPFTGWSTRRHWLIPADQG